MADASRRTSGMPKKAERCRDCRELSLPIVFSFADGGTLPVKGMPIAYLNVRE
tara:strand:- start:161 stop:319 length:159 start_codon:yes stop_codon:yes gene_type:complete